jgi:DNA replication licensing factor MCM5
VSQLVMIPGIITAATKPRHMATTVTVMCKDCKLTQTVPGPTGLGPIALPRTCNLSGGLDGAPNAGCSMDPWVVLPQKSTFVDQQQLKLQVSPFRTIAIS